MPPRTILKSYTAREKRAALASAAREKAALATSTGAAAGAVIGSILSTLAPAIFTDSVLLVITSSVIGALIGIGALIFKKVVLKPTVSAGHTYHINYGEDPHVREAEQLTQNPSEGFYQCPRCGKSTLARLSRERYACLNCFFERDFSRQHNSPFEQEDVSSLVGFVPLLIVVSLMLIILL